MLRRPAFPLMLKLGLAGALLSAPGGLSFTALAQTDSGVVPATVSQPGASPLSTKSKVPTGVTVPVPVSVASAQEPRSGPTVRARVAQGALLGIQSNGVNYFLGVPYAAAPVGAGRWKAPQPLIPWVGERSFRHYGHICPQRPNSLDATNDNQMYGSEDCLFVNVYAPPNAKHAPVMFWVHGGSFDGGSGNQYDGSALARRYGVVVITINYRLGVFGFLAAPQIGEGNYGLMDIKAALRWAQTNARSFGGDGSDITIFGESAGGMAICTLLTAPSAAGLFQKAIIQSGPCQRGVGSAPLQQMSQIGDAFVKSFNCTGQLALSCMQGQSTLNLFNTRLPGAFIPGQVKFPPVYNSELLPQNPLTAFGTGQVNKVPLMIGSNRNEGTPFTAYLTKPNTPLNNTLYFTLVAMLNPGHLPDILRHYPSYRYSTTALAGAALVTDGLFACPTDAFGRLYARQAPTYRYEFSDPKAVTALRSSISIPVLEAYHASELIYVFNRPLRGLADPVQFGPQQAQLSAQMGQYWTNFARTGNPNGPSLSSWPSYTSQHQDVMTLAPEGNTVNTQFGQQHQCAFWDRLDANQF